MKKLKKITIIAIYIILIISLFSNVFADDSLAKKFDGKITDSEAEGGKTAIIQIVASVLGVTRIIGSGVAVSILMVIACKYIIASAGDRADIKKYAVNYVIGALVLFGASGIASILKKFTDSAIGG